MARTRVLRSATSQFYINLVDNRALDYTGLSPDDFGYAVFGRVLSGMDVVDRIVAVARRRRKAHGRCAGEPVVIKRRQRIDRSRISVAFRFPPSSF